MIDNHKNIIKIIIYFLNKFVMFIIFATIGIFIKLFSSATDCRIDQFTCDNGKCLNLDLRCNKHADCPNGEDERGCYCKLL